MKLFNALALIVASCIVSVSVHAEYPVVRIGGTGGSVAMMRILANAYQAAYPARRVEVVPSLGSNGGMQALASKKIDLAISAMQLNKSAQAINATSIEYARTPYMITTHPGIKLDNISSQQLANILSGKTKAWENGQRLRLIMRPLDDSDTHFLRSIDPAVNAAVNATKSRKGMIIAPTDQDSANFLVSTPGAFGVTTVAQNKAEKRGLAAVKLNGIEPSVENIESGVYRHYKSLSIVTWPEPGEAVQHFIDYIRSESGTQLLKDHGHMVLTKKPTEKNI